MKEIIIAIILLSSALSYAQEQESIFIEDGQWGLGGRFSLATNKVEFKKDNFTSSSEDFNIDAMPKVSYAIEDNWLVGLSLIYSYNDHQGSNEVITHAIGLAPSLQRYFPIVESFAVSLEGSLEYVHGWSKNSFSPTPEPYTQDRYSVVVRPGFSYFLGKHFALEASTGFLGFTRNKSGIEEFEEREENMFRFSFDLSNIQFGANYFF